MVFIKKQRCFPFNSIVVAVLTPPDSEDVLVACLSRVFCLAENDRGVID